MLDVVHFFFEEDHRYQTPEEAKSVEAIRAAIYETMYKKNFRYKVSNSNSTSGSAYTSNETKPYIPPTEFDPEVGLIFGKNVESPLR